MVLPNHVMSYNWLLGYVIAGGAINMYYVLTCGIVVVCVIYLFVELWWFVKLRSCVVFTEFLCGVMLYN